MSSLVWLLLITFVPSVALAQQTPDNYSFFKLVVTNEKNEILLVNYQNQWEVMGERYNKGVSVLAFVDTLAQSMGIRVKQAKLAALFTQRLVTRSNPTLFQYYTAHYESGTFRSPADCSAIRWFSYEEALQVIPYEVMKAVLVNIRKQPGKVLGAHFVTTVDPQTKKTKVTTKEDFYLLN